MDDDPFAAFSADARVPASEQLRLLVQQGVDAGALVAGTRLPTVRGLAERLGLAPNTVARAYRELESDGFLETRGRAGTFVRARTGETERQASRAAAVYAAEARRLGLGQEDALRYVRAALGAGRTE